MTLKLPEGLRKRLKTPLGDFITNSSSLKGKTLVCVGDQTSKEALAMGFKPKVCIYDGMIQRKAVELPEEIKKFKAFEISVENQPGGISREALKAVEKALKSKGEFKIKVNGEEDLLTLPAVKYAPLGSIVLYGQPNEGLVGVEVNEANKKKIEAMLREMEDGC
jgi:uncharacterized protein (UPF0218 family)